MSRQRSLARQLRRRSEREAEELLATRWGQVMTEVSDSLGMGPTDLADGLLVLDQSNPAPSSSAQLAADKLWARMLEVLEVLGYSRLGDVAITDERAELEQRCGAAFLIEVSKTGEPASEAAVRIRYIM